MSQRAHTDCYGVKWIEITGPEDVSEEHVGRFLWREVEDGGVPVGIITDIGMLEDGGYELVGAMYTTEEVGMGPGAGLARVTEDMDDVFSVTRERPQDLMRMQEEAMRELLDEEEDL